jgi:hypothetical protein
MKVTSDQKIAERPILMCRDMVLATLEGRKTKTRRVVLPQPKTAQMISPSTASLSYPAMLWRKSPYGEPSNRLWVREAWTIGETRGDNRLSILYKVSNDMRPNGVSYEEFGSGKWFTRPLPEVEKWKSEIERQEVEGGRHYPSIHMPRWASRITLEITKVRVERLQDITAADVAAEGVTYPVSPSEKFPGKCSVLWNISSEFSPLNYIAEKDRGDHEKILIAHYAALWDSLNAKRKDPAGKVGAYSWAKNPFVWVIEFRVLADRIGRVRKAKR